MKRRAALWVCLVVCLLALSVLSGCASRYSVEGLRALNPSALVVETCVRHPMMSELARVYAHNTSTGETQWDDQWGAFEDFAKTADVLYRYDPYLWSALSYPLPWPYEHMTCDWASSQAPRPALPKGMWTIPISNRTHEALVTTLIASANVDDTVAWSDSPAQGGDKRFVAQHARVFTKRPNAEQLAGVAQILRDAIRGVLPTVQGPDSSQISIIDTKTGQVVGGVGAGIPASLAPGGTFVADGLMSSHGTTREFMVAEKATEVVLGAGQVILGGSMALGGGGASLTGGGAIVGVPVCVAGVALATNGAITFMNGAKSLIVAVCNWDELPPAPILAAARLPDSAPGVAPTPAPAAAAKPAQVPPKPTVKPAGSPTGQTAAPGPKRRGSGTKSGKNTTTWVKCTGQWHHAISKRVHDALEDHRLLKGLYKHRDDRFVTQAVDKAAHKGYQKWHRLLDDEVADWIKEHEFATAKDFEAYLAKLYAEPRLKAIFPNGF